MAFLVDAYPALAFSFVAWGMVIGRGMLGVSEVLMRDPRPGLVAQWRGWSQATLPLLITAALVLTSLGVLAPGLVFVGILPDTSGRPIFVAWAVFSWTGWLVRPFGPMGFVGFLTDRGFPQLKALGLQLEAFQKNQLSIMGLFALWAALLCVMAVFPWVIVPALLWWPLVMRCAFADLFEGGIRIARPAPAAAKASARALVRPSV